MKTACSGESWFRLGSQLLASLVFSVNSWVSSKQEHGKRKLFWYPYDSTHVSVFISLSDPMPNSASFHYHLNDCIVLGESHEKISNAYFPVCIRKSSLSLRTSFTSCLGKVFGALGALHHVATNVAKFWTICKMQINLAFWWQHHGAWMFFFTGGSGRKPDQGWGLPLCRTMIIKVEWLRPKCKSLDWNPTKKAKLENWCEQMLFIQSDRAPAVLER